MTTKTQIHKGDYFYTSWGYDQTNIDYLVVIAISFTGKTAKCRMAHKLALAEDLAYTGITPAEPYGDAFTMRITERGTLRGSYPYISSMPKEKRLDSFLPVDFGAIAWETKPEFGH